MPRYAIVTLLAGIAAALLATPMVSGADDHAVILLYHHVADNTPSSTSVTPETFASHLEYLEDNDFRVLPLDEVLDAIANKKPLPENTVAITFDDAYRSVYTTARPMLEVRDWPYTVFVSTDYVDKGYDNYMSWAQLRAITEQRGSIGNHGVEHESALARGRNESKGAWLERLRLDAVKAQERISAETSTVPTIYAWPYGEFNADVEAVIRKLGWYALGQQSGAAGYSSSMTAVPRYPQATGYDDIDAFRLRVHSEPLPITITGAPERLLASGSPAPELSFRLDDEHYNTGGVNCFNSRGERLEMARSGETMITARSASALPTGRSKYTCTAAHRVKRGVFGWYSHLWIVQGGSR